MAIGLSIVVGPYLGSSNVLYNSIIGNIPVVLKGFIISTLLIIVISKADAHANSSGMILLKNLSTSRIRECIGDLSLARICTCIVVVLGVYVASLNLPIVKTIIFIETVWGVLIGIPIIASLLLQYGNSRVFWRYLCVTIPLFIGYCFYSDFNWFLLLFILTSALIFFLISLMTERRLQVTLSKIYKSCFDVFNVVRFQNFGLRNLVEFSSKRVGIIGADYFTFVVFFGVNYTIPVILSVYSMEHIMAVVLLRIISVVLCFILMAKNWWPVTCKKYFPLYWHLF